jgi:hypothetical protein
MGDRNLPFLDRNERGGFVLNNYVEHSSAN